jgi:hypothetical protein
LVALDGTQYFDSQTIHCECCSSRTHKNGTITYFHSAILPPGQSQVISLVPEFITPQDGSQKQDSEVAAAKRWISNYAPEFKNQPIRLLGDETILDFRFWILDFGLEEGLICPPPPLQG